MNEQPRDFLETITAKVRLKSTETSDDVTKTKRQKRRQIKGMQKERRRCKMSRLEDLQALHTL